MVKRTFSVTTMVALIAAAAIPRVLTIGGVGGLTAAGSEASAAGMPAELPHRAVCGVPAPHFASCQAEVVTNPSGVPLSSQNPSSSSYGPAQFHTGYSLPCAPGGPVQSVCTTPSTFGPRTIAIVDAYSDPTVQNDLNVYDAQYALPACTTANGCLTVISENGGTQLPTTVDQSWALETSLDVQTAHEICQTCRIMLVEANTNSFTDLAAGVSTAAKLGATSISNSYGGSEWSGESIYDSYYNHAGVAVVASSGDSGYTAEYPATSQYVIAAGGTTLTLHSDNTYSGETAWSSGGSGCSAYEPANSWQTGVGNWAQTGCGTHHGSVDISADADPSTGAAVYDSTGYGSATGWFKVGGTSLAAPLIASIFALAGGVPSGLQAQSILYANVNATNSHDVSSGSNGSCGTIMCTSTVGYDGPTGLGTPNGTGAFVGSSSSPGPTPTPTVTPCRKNGHSCK